MGGVQSLPLSASDRDGRIFVGGENVDFSSARQRDDLIRTKAGTISAKASALLGGNGIAFSAMAADLLLTSLAGTDHPDLACFDPYRFPN